jgi:hypothetical protein
MHNEQEQRSSGLKIHRAKRMPSLLASLIDAVGHDQTTRIIEDPHRELEADAVMFAD